MVKKSLEGSGLLSRAGPRRIRDRAFLDVQKGGLVFSEHSFAIRNRLSRGPSCALFFIFNLPPLPLSTRRRRSALAAVIARGQAGLAAEELREMARVGVTDFERDFDNALFCFPEQTPRRLHAQIELVT